MGDHLDNKTYCICEALSDGVEEGFPGLSVAKLNEEMAKHEDN